MKNEVIASLVFGFCLLFVMQTAIAADVTSPKDTMKISAAIQKVQSNGYKIIREIKFKNGYYEAKVITPEGKKLDIRVNTKTGEVEKPKSESKILSMLEIIKKVQSAGYKNISKISFDDDEYEVDALDKHGKEVNLEIKADSGKIKKDWF